MDKGKTTRLDEATAWFAAIRKGAMPVEERQAFDRWRADPRNQAALDSLHELWGELAVLKYVDPSPLRKRGLNPVLAAAVALLVLAGGLGFAWLSLKPGRMIETAIGEQRTQPLPDGSVIAVNVATQLTYTFEGDRRQIDLVDGEAAFSVKSDPQQPFIVRAGAYEVRAVGTAFNVRERADVVEIAVGEGVVDVCRAGEGGEVLLRLSGGQAVTMPAVWSAGQPLTARPIRSDEVGQWRMRVASYEDAALGEIVADLNRYFEKPLVIDDKSLLATRLTLRLELAERDNAVGTLARLLNLEVHEGDRTSVLTRGGR